MKKGFSVRELTLIGVLAALVFAGSMIQIPVPAVIGITRFHLGNILCLLSGLLLGPVAGGFAGGLGSAFFDLTDPRFTPSLPFTFAFKFAMAFLCGLIAHSGGAAARRWRRNLVATVSGAVLYIILYLGRYFITDYFFLRLEIETVWIDLSTKAVTSSVNGVIGVVGALLLATAIRQGLVRSGFQGEFFAKRNKPRPNGES